MDDRQSEGPRRTTVIIREGDRTQDLDDLLLTLRILSENHISGRPAVAAVLDALADAVADDRESAFAHAALASGASGRGYDEARRAWKGSPL